MSGNGTSWIRLKSLVKQHMCLTDGCQHLQAVYHKDQTKTFVKRCELVLYNMITACLTVIKEKAAAKHYETQIACLQMVNADIGNIGHGRKQVPEMLESANHVIDETVENVLKTPLKNTTKEFCSRLARFKLKIGAG